MVLTDYMKIAADWITDIAAENGIKIRRGDFGFYGDKRKTVITDSGWYYTSIELNPVGAADNYTGVTATVWYNSERFGKQFKDKRDSFYNYVFARVTDKFILFAFSLKELEIHSFGSDDAENEKIEKVIAKVQKLLNLADPSRNPSEQEAIAASLQAQRLLAKYNLDMSAVGGKEKDEEIQQVVADVGAGKKWKYTLADVVAHSYCCKCFFHGSEQIVFYGYQSDVLIARRIFAYLFAVGNRLAGKYAKDRRDWEGSADGVYNSFCMGFVAGVKSELDKNCTALMLVVPQKVEESFAEFTADFKKANHSIKMNDKDAVAAGYVEGQRALRAQYIEG